MITFYIMCTQHHRVGQIFITFSLSVLLALFKFWVKMLPIFAEVRHLIVHIYGLLYAPRVFRTHGIPVGASLYNMCRETVVVKLLYCAPGWSGWCLAADRVQLDSFLHWCKRQSHTDLSHRSDADNKSLQSIWWRFNCTSYSSSCHHHFHYP